MNYHELDWSFATTQEPLLVTATDPEGCVHTMLVLELPEDIEVGPCTVVNPGD